MSLDCRNRARPPAANRGAGMTGIGSPAAKLPRRAETRRTVPPKLVAWTLLRTPEPLRIFLRQGRLQADAITLGLTSTIMQHSNDNEVNLMER